jgi:hypothetical protein
MFDRSRSPNSVESTGEAVRLTLIDGSRLDGTILVPSTSRLDAYLNNGEPFLAFIAHDGERQFIAKAQIRSLCPLAVPRADQLSRRQRQAGAFDPYETLEIEPGAGPEAVRQAFLMMARLYHPDRFAGIDLPREVASYLKAMQQRINLAYETLSPGKAAAA